MANNGNWKTAFQQIAELSQVEAMASIPFGDDFAENRVRLLNELMPKMGVLAPEEAEQLFVAKVMEKSPFLNNTVPREFSSSVVSTTFKKILTRLRAVTSQNPTTQAIRTGVIGAINTWFSGETHPSPPPLQSMGEPVVNTSEGIADPAESSANPVGAPGQQSSGTPEAAGSNVMSEAADEGIESSSVTEVDIMQEFCKLDVGKAMLQEMQARVSDWNQWIHQKGLEKEVFFERYQGPEVPMGYLKLWCMAFGQYGRLSKPDTVVEAVFNKFQELWGPHLPWKAYAECVRHVQQNPHGPVAPVNRSAYSDVGDRLVREKNKLKQVRNEAPTGKFPQTSILHRAVQDGGERLDVAETAITSAQLLRDSFGRYDSDASPLVERAIKRIRSVRSPSTWRNHDRGLQRWYQFSSLGGIHDVKPNPADYDNSHQASRHLTLFITWLADEMGLSSHQIKSLLGGVKLAMKQGTATEVADQNVRAALASVVLKPPKRKPAFRYSWFQDLFLFCRRVYPLDGYHKYTAALLMYWALLRPSELSIPNRSKAGLYSTAGQWGVRIRDVTVAEVDESTVCISILAAKRKNSDNHLVRLRGPKIGQYKGVLTLAKAWDALDMVRDHPVAFLQRFLAIRKLMLARLTQQSSMLLLQQNNCGLWVALSSNAITNMTKRFVKETLPHLRPEDYTAYCLRTGGVTQYASNGLTAEEITQLGGWSTNGNALRYLRSELVDQIDHPLVAARQSAGLTRTERRLGTPFHLSDSA